MAPRKTTLEFKFWSRVNEVDGCWLWRDLDRRGYGRLCYRGNDGRVINIRAHRLSWQIHFGDPGDMLVCHRCDVPNCVNPNHLYLGTHEENTADMIRRGRNQASIEKSRKLTDNQVREIRELLAQGHMTQKEIGGLYGVSQMTVQRIGSGENWSHLK